VPTALSPAAFGPRVARARGGHRVARSPGTPGARRGPRFPGVRARRLLQRPPVRRGLALTLALATGLSVATLVRSGDAARRSWGTTRPVAVATRDLAPGDVVGAGAVDVRSLPEAMVPAGALAAVAPGAVVRLPVVEGEALVAARLAPHGLSGAAALVPEGYRAVAVPVAGAPPLTVGDQVDVLAVLPPERAASDEPAFPLVERAVVVDVGDEGVTVAVPRPDSPRVAFALAQGVVVLALAGP
jgi:Flp pilus assembly protein CpaB